MFIRIFDDYQKHLILRTFYLKGMYGTICGSDGVTYDNDCNMWQKACKTKTAIMRLYDGECGNPVNANGMRIIPM